MITIRNKNLLSVLKTELLKGKSNKDIAIALNFSESYIKSLISKLFKLYKVKNRTELALEFRAEKEAKI